MPAQGLANIYAVYFPQRLPHMKWMMRSVNKIIRMYSQPLDASGIVDNRVIRIQQHLEAEKDQILENVSQQISNFLARNQNKQDSVPSQNTEKCFSLYFCACQNLMNDKQFIQLQSEQAIMEKLGDFKKGIKKHLNSLQERTSMSLREWQEKQTQQKKLDKSFRTQAKNMKIPTESSTVLIQWLIRNFKNPYPTEEEKKKLSEESRLSLSQINNWFINARQRVIKKYLKKGGNKRATREETLQQ